MMYQTPPSSESNADPTHQRRPSVQRRGTSPVASDSNKVAAKAAPDSNVTPVGDVARRGYVDWLFMMCPLPISPLYEESHNNDEDGHSPQLSQLPW